MIVNLSRILDGSVAGLGFALAIAGCDPAGSQQRRLVSRYYASTDSMGATPTNLSIVRTTAPTDLVENSAATMSMTQPGIFFSINDSGNDALLFALDTTGRGRGVWRVTNANDSDWEAASVGPCAAGVASWCVYIGDVGDNEARRRSRRIYRVPEPRAAEPGVGRPDSLSAERLTFEYPNGPQDVEAMYVARNGDAFLIAKRPRLDAARRPLPALVYRLPASAWQEKGDRRAVAELVDSLPISPGSAPFRVITDAALSPDAKHLAVRTYMQLYVFATDPATGRVNREVAPMKCNLLTVDESQGEGVTWANSSGRFVFTTEGQRAPIALADCPLPN